MSERIIYDGGDLVVAMQEKLDELETALNDFQSGGIALALAEQEYKIALRKNALVLKDKGYSATMIDKVILGIEDVANTRYRRDVQEALYEAQKERINITKLEIRILEAQIAREFGKYTGTGAVA